MEALSFIGQVRSSTRLFGIEAGSYGMVDITGLKVYGKDEWHQEKHNMKAKHSRCKLHRAIDEKHQIIASALTEKKVGDTAALPALLEQKDDFKMFMADGAYDNHKVYEQVLQNAMLQNHYLSEAQIP